MGVRLLKKRQGFNSMFNPKGGLINEGGEEELSNDR